jgi:hypothetical protein
MSLVLQKNASVRNARCIVPVSLTSRAATEPPPTFPFLESQCQRATPKANLHSTRDGTPPARRGPTGGVGAVYRGLVFPSQTVNPLIFRIFLTRLWIDFRIPLGPSAHIKMVLRDRDFKLRNRIRAGLGAARRDRAGCDRTGRCRRRRNRRTGRCCRSGTRGRGPSTRAAGGRRGTGSVRGLRRLIARRRRGVSVGRIGGVGWRRAALIGHRCRRWGCGCRPA